MGYAGGSQENPAYYSLGDHSETVQIVYDPTRITYRELLDIFWQSHSPTHPSWSQQYASRIFYHNDEQQKLAVESSDRETARRGSLIYTEIAPYLDFYMAEDYHQKYYLQQVPELFKDFSAIYPEVADLVTSTAAARVNGYLGGYGSLETLPTEIDDLGLSQTGKERLLEIVGAMDRKLSKSCPAPPASAF